MYLLFNAGRTGKQLGSSFQFTRFISYVRRVMLPLSCDTSVPPIHLPAGSHYSRGSDVGRTEGVKRNHYPGPLALLLIYRRKLGEIIGNRLNVIRDSPSIHLLSVSAHDSPLRVLSFSVCVRGGSTREARALRSSRPSVKN